MSPQNSQKKCHRKFIIAVVAAAAALTAVPVLAADLGYSLKDQPYDEDPRYSDIYRHPAPPPPRYAAPYPPPTVYRQDNYATPPYVPPHQQHGYRQDGYRQDGYRQDGYRQEGRYAGDCLPRDTVRARLEQRGWYDFHDPQVTGNVVHIRARRDNGRLYDVTLDRCSGQVMGAEAIRERSAQAPLAPVPLPPYGGDYRYRDPRGGY